IERLQRVDRELKNGDVRVRVKMREDAPCPVIESPLIAIEAHPGRLHSLNNLTGNVRCAGSRVIKIEQLLRKPIEVMNGTWPFHRRDGSGAKMPMRRDNQDRPRTPQCLAQRPPAL